MFSIGLSMMGTRELLVVITVGILEDIVSRGLEVGEFWASWFVWLGCRLEANGFGLAVSKGFVGEECCVKIRVFMRNEKLL